MASSSIMASTVASLQPHLDYAHNDTDRI